MNGAPGLQTVHNVQAKPTVRALPPLHAPLRLRDAD